jgi:bloom syndrome protein
MYSNIEQETAIAKWMPWYKEVKKALRERFKFTGFRHHQLDTINATLDRKDAFVLMTTGASLLRRWLRKLPLRIQAWKQDEI